MTYIYHQVVARQSKSQSRSNGGHTGQGAQRGQHGPGARHHNCHHLLRIATILLEGFENKLFYENNSIPRSFSGSKKRVCLVSDQMSDQKINLKLNWNLNLNKKRVSLVSDQKLELKLKLKLCLVSDQKHESKLKLKPCLNWPQT